MRPTVVANPYAYEVIPPAGRLLDAIIAHCAVGGTIQPGNRTLAAWADYASCSQIPSILSRLATDGWITYDPKIREITLLRTYGEVQP